MFEIRHADAADMGFLLSLASRLAGVPRPDWHSLEEMNAFQDRFMALTFGTLAARSLTLIATRDGTNLGYIHVHEGRDGVTDEPCAYVAILVLEEQAQGQGISSVLMRRAEDWARAQNYRFLSLDAFATNKRALD